MVANLCRQSAGNAVGRVPSNELRNAPEDAREAKEDNTSNASALATAGSIAGGLDLRRKLGGSCRPHDRQNEAAKSDRPELGATPSDRPANVGLLSQA